MQDYKSLKVWQNAHALALEVYSLTSKFPKEELYGLVNQIRRATISIAANIAEGSSRTSNKDFSRFLQISFGSAKEVEYEILLSKDLNFIEVESFEKIQHQIEEIKKMLVGLMKAIR